MNNFVIYGAKLMYICQWNLNSIFIMTFKRAILLIFVSLFFIVGTSAQYQESDNIRKLINTLRIINFTYVDTVDNDKLTEAAIVAMLKELDPHSNYFSKDEIKAANEPLEGNFEGIGIQFQIFKDTILVVAPIQGGPSAKVGVRAGDKIVKINDENATGKEITNKYVQDHLRGEKGSEVTISVKRNGQKNLIDFTIIRDEIPLNSVDAAYMLNDNTGLIKIIRFSKNTVTEFKEAMARLNKQGMENLVLDLRSNPGGYLQTAVELADQFLADGQMIVFTEGRSSPKRTFEATKEGIFEKGNLIVLINEGSASASEIVSGAVQDWGRGLIVGRRSFGKGLVQRPFQLPDSAVIRLTTARYHTPSGRCIQKPYDNGKEAYYHDLEKRMKNGEFFSADSIHFPDSLKYTTPNGRTVYGGGGIMPDIFVPYDSTEYSDYYTNLLKERIVNDYILEYFDKNRQDLEKNYKTPEDIIENFDTEGSFIKDFIDYGEKHGVPFDEEGYAQSEKQIKAMLKALIARNLFDVSAYYEVISQVDITIQKALELLEEKNAFSENKIRSY